MKVKFRRVTNLLSTIISVQIKRLLKLRGTYKTTTTTKCYKDINEGKHRVDASYENSKKRKKGELDD